MVCITIILYIHQIIFFIVSFHYKQSCLEANQVPIPSDLSLEEQYEEDNVSENDSNDDEDHSGLFSW